MDRTYTDAERGIISLSFGARSLQEARRKVNYRIRALGVGHFRRSVHGLSTLDGIAGGRANQNPYWQSLGRVSCLIEVHTRRRHVNVVYSREEDGMRHRQVE